MHVSSIHVRVQLQAALVGAAGGTRTHSIDLDLFYKGPTSQIQIKLIEIISISFSTVL